MRHHARHPCRHDAGHGRLARSDDPTGRSAQLDVSAAFDAPEPLEAHRAQEAVERQE